MKNCLNWPYINRNSLESNYKFMKNSSKQLKIGQKTNKMAENNLQI